MKTFLRSLFLLTAIIWLPLMTIAKAGAQELQTANEIVIIDPDLQDGNILINALKPGTKWFFLDRSQQLVPFVSDILSRYAPIKSLHLVTHGMPGAIYTTGTFLNNEITDEEQAEIKRWKNNFSSDGSILLYGCEVAKGPEGKAFCVNLSEISGLNVSASTDKTGSPTLGGDWDLELSTRGIEIQTCFSSAITSYNQLLAKVLVWTGPVTGNYYCNTLTAFYNNQAGHSAVHMIDKGTTIPDLSAYTMVFAILPERTLNSTEIKNLKDLLGRGGRIVWVGEHSGYASMNNVITAAVAALGGHLSIQSLLLDKNSTYLPDTHINMSSPLMKGVTRLYGNAVSAINIGGEATVLVKMHDDLTKITMAQERIGNGDIIAWADVNHWDKINDASFGTATFFRNLLSGTIERIQSLLVATLTTTEAYSISGKSATTGGNITEDNGSPITERGICWSTSTASPTTSNNKVVASGTGSGLFTCQMTNISLNTKYYVKAYAINSKGTSYGNTVIFTTPSVSNTLPTAVADNFTCQKNGTITGKVMSNDFDADSDPMTASLVTAPSYDSGTFTLNPNGTFSYTNNGTNAPSDFFSYFLSDGKSFSSTVGVSISTYTTSQPPVGANESVTINSGEIFGFTAADFSFSDADSSHVFNGIRLVVLPSKGHMKYNGFSVSAGAICNDVTRLTFDSDGESGGSPFTSFSFKVEASSDEESISEYTMTINKSEKTPAKVTLSDLVQTYTGSPLPVTIITDPAGLKTIITYNGSETIPTNAGTYSVVATIDDATYKGTTSESFKIGKASLTVTADDKKRTYGEPDPDLSVSYSGFVKGDDIDDLDAKPKASTGANLNSDAGTYDITVFGGSDNNYSYIFNKGTLTIDKADQVITFKNIPADLRSQQEYQLVATSTSGLPVSFNSSESTIASISGDYMTVGKEGTVRIIASQEGNHNWNPAPDVIQTITTLQAFNKIKTLFTPNNDGMNDYWIIPDIELYGDISVKIFNRFGKLLYESFAYNNDWDGTYNGAPLPSASYAYIIKSSEKGIIKGVVNMVR